jgi:peptide/nickel transport system permease protein
MESRSGHETEEILGLTDLGGDGLLHSPAPALGGDTIGLARAGFAADPTLRQVSPAAAPQKWYQGLGWGFWAAFGYVVLWVLIAIFAGVLPLADPSVSNGNCILNAGLSSAHWLGCDENGRDILSRVIFGSRVSLIVGFASVALSLTVGGTLGLIAGYFRGWIDDVMIIISNVFLSFPAIVLGLLVVSYLGNSLFNIVVILAMISWPLLFRVVRASTIEYSQREYVLAAQALGSTRGRILLKILLPDVIPSAMTYALVGVALSIVGEGALSFLGESVGIPTPTWGNMIGQGSTEMQQYSSLLFSPAVAMFTFILAVNFLGDRMRSVLDVRQGVL